MASCFSCGTHIDAERVYRSTECPACGKAVKVCRNCRFYSPGAHWNCRETIGEPVREKDTVNFCDYFQLAEDSADDSPDAPSRSAFDSLFDS